VLIGSTVRTASPHPRVTVPDTSAPVVSFVTVTYGTGPIVVDMIESLVATCSLPCEVIVVDNAHPTRPGRARAELLAATSGVRLVEASANLGFGGGCNAGIERARGRLVALVNPDLVAQPGWLEPLVEVLDTDPTVGIAAAVLLDPDGSIQECGQMLYADGTTAPRRVPPTGTDPIEVDHASAACWLMRTVDVSALGGFDEAFHPAYFEDVDLALRVRRDGRRVVVHPLSRVVHHTGTGTPDPPLPAFAQLDTLRRRWPDLATTQPRPPAG
jgi:O-antigen biosynthesis protein